MIESYDISYLEKLIENEVEENLHLEYKGAEALGKSDGKKKEISKDISAFANSDGGSIIYGIKEFDETEKRHLPERIDGIERDLFNKEWLEQIINSSIQPRIPNLVIVPINIPTSPGKVVFFVEIPKSQTAHQAKDKRYYKRFNFESVPMEDYEIKDILNRSQSPKIDIEFEIEIEEYEDKPMLNIPKIGALGNLEYEAPKIKTITTLYVFANNAGRVYANFVNCFIEIPLHILNDEDRKNVRTIDEIEYATIYCDNTTREVVDVVNTGLYARNKYGPARYEPILPKVRSKLTAISLKNDINFTNIKLFWSVYADNADETSGEIELKEIKIK